MPNNKPKVAIFIAAEYISLFTSISLVLQKKYNVDTILILRDRGVQKEINKIFPSRDSTNDFIISDLKIPDIADNEIISSALAFEIKYGFTISQMISEDRALGQGYLFNVEKIPHVIRSNWKNDRKIKDVIFQIYKYEKLLEGVDLVINRWPDKIISRVSRYNNAKHFCLTSVRFGDRKFWSDDDFITSKSLIKNVKENLKLNLNEYIIPEYQIDPYTNKANSLNFNYYSSIKEGYKTIWNELKKWLRWLQKKDSYRFLGWLPSSFRRVGNYKFVDKVSVKPNDVKGNRIIYMTLHLEPEVSMLFFSPEFSNSMEAISMISKSMPADTLLIVKEHPHSYGVRSRWYYKQINKIGNVFWSNALIDSNTWIENSDAIATITGTVAVEAVNKNKPVISLGAHQIVNYLPTVFYVSNLNQCRTAVKNCLSGFEYSEYESSSKSLIKAQLETSFDLPGYAESVKSKKPQIEMAETALEHLFIEIEANDKNLFVR
jgi:hypothetical protein